MSHAKRNTIADCLLLGIRTAACLGALAGAVAIIALTFLNLASGCGQPSGGCIVVAG